ncbi:hypothetical protein ABFX02_11G111600 [Erythranthe guttata]
MEKEEDDHHDFNNSSSSSQIEKWCGHEFLYKFNGFWFTKTYLKTTQKVLQHFKPLPNDVILASFPKTGTTWLKALLHSIIHRHSPNHSSNTLLLNHPQELIPSLETNLYVQNGNFIPTIIEDQYNKGGGTSSRILATHIPYQIIGDLLRGSSTCKIVYVTRNPKDTLISLWHFLHKSGNVFASDPWELPSAVDQFCRGIVPFGSYYDHVLAYREESRKEPEKVFFVTYEELKENPNGCVERIAEFLGCPFEGGEEDHLVGEIVKNCSFENLSGHEVNMSNEMPPSGFPLPYSSFFRKGEVGDHVNYLGEEMVRMIDDVTREKFHGGGFVYGV